MARSIYGVVLLTFVLTFLGCKSDADKQPLSSIDGLTSEVGVEKTVPPFVLRVDPLVGIGTGQATGSRSLSEQKTVVFRLKLAGATPGAALPALLLQAAPTGWTPDQVQIALLYHMEAAAVLRVGNQTIRPVHASAEIGMANDKQLTVVFVFPISPAKLLDKEETVFELSDAFFLPLPETFRFNQTDLKRAFQQTQGILN